MNRLPKLSIVFAVLLCVFAATYQKVSLGQSTITLPTNGNAVRVNITTGGGVFGAPKERYRVGQRIPVSITMTNTSDSAVQVCVSGSLYQDRPALIKDGKTVSYSEWQSQTLRASQSDKACANVDLPEPITLQPKASHVVDWFILADSARFTGAMAWYDSLQPGKYELSLERRLTCCDGPMIQSNKIRFEVVP